MRPTTAQPEVWGNNCNPCAAPGVFQNSTPAGGKLWGSSVRLLMGIAQIICGVIELALGTAVICVPTRYYDDMDNVGWGIWTGVFAIVTGFLGVFSLRMQCMVIAYMVCSIIAAVMGAGSCIYAGIGAGEISYEVHYHYDYSYPRANMPLYIVMCITFFVQMVTSIIGASFTCGALSCRRNQTERIVYYTLQPMPLQHIPAPPYTVNALPNCPAFETTAQNPT